MANFDLGLVGVGVMGANLARNFADHGVTLALMDADNAATGRLATELGAKATAATSTADLVAALARPRALFLMVPAGKPVDATLDALLPLLATGDIVIDGGNSHYLDTERRGVRCAAQGVAFCGTGVSGGSEGARHGPAIMAGGPQDAFARIGPWLAAIAARADGAPCYARVGGGGAGHFVKMVHNGIEYAVMQLIAETYQIAREILGLGNAQLADLFAAWAHEQDSFLLSCTADVLRADDPVSGGKLIDVIEDSAEQKGTGRWATEAALLYGTPVPTLGEAVMARALSALRSERARLAKAIPPARTNSNGDAAALQRALRDALLAATLCAYDQGFQLIAAGSTEHKWDIDRALVARVWRGGCIVRAALLKPIAAAYEAQPARPTLLDDAAIARTLSSGEPGWRRLVAAAVGAAIPVPAYASALSWVDGLRTARLPTNLIAGQRDHFGQHGFARLDRPGRHHGPWNT